MQGQESEILGLPMSRRSQSPGFNSSARKYNQDSVFVITYVL